MGGIRSQVEGATRRAARQAAGSRERAVATGRRISQAAIDRATGGATRRARNARRRGQ